MQQVAALSALTSPMPKEPTLLLALEEAQTIMQPGTPSHEVCAACPITYSQATLYSDADLTCPSQQNWQWSKGYAACCLHLRIQLESVSHLLPCQNSVAPLSSAA